MKTLPSRGDALGHNTERPEGLGPATSLLCGWNKAENGQRRAWTRRQGQGHTRAPNNLFSLFAMRLYSTHQVPRYHSKHLMHRTSVHLHRLMIQGLLVIIPVLQTRKLRLQEMEVAGFVSGRNRIQIQEDQIPSPLFILTGHIP